MQFHLNGYRSGDPAVTEADAARPPSVPDQPLPSEVDVLIVGCGPTGLTLAAQLWAFPELSVCIVDLKPGPLQLGQADGIACRSMEMFNAFGFADRVMKEAYWVNETVFWKPDPDAPDHIARSDRIQDVEDGLSEFPHVILNQARVHDFFLDTMCRAPGGLTPHYGRRLVGLELPKHLDQPTIGRFDRPDPGVGSDRAGPQETVQARFVIGCDGARSAVRRFMGRTLTGDAANQAWGVMDVLAVTDFPDVRYKTIVHSNQGNLIIIPREGGYMFRLYIELDKLGKGERVADHGITVDRLIEAGQQILAPYSLEVKEVVWWSVYEIGQRLCDKYDDVAAEDVDHTEPRVFIAGDACHTHSPKAGQGMNVSMRDGFNLGWKLASVLRGRSDPKILHTYSAERWAVAKELIDFDRELAQMFTSTSKATADEPDAGGGADPEVFQQHFQRSGRFTAGVMTKYGPSLLVGDTTYQSLASGFEIGTRFHSAPVIRAADAKPTHIGHVVAADGRWRLFAFADRAGVQPGSRLHALCQFLQTDPASPVRRFTAEGDDIDANIDVRAVLQQGHRAVVLSEFPPILKPTKGRYGLVDYQKVFCPNLKEGPDIFDVRGISRESGATVLIRPDQHVAHVLPLDAHAKLSGFFEGFMISQT